MTEHEFDDEPPSGDAVTAYDEGHLVTYLRVLDAAAENADWQDVARVIFSLDPQLEPEKSKKVYESHLARARWMTQCGYRDLVAKTRR